LLRPQVLEVNAFAFRQPMLPADDELESLGEKRPGAEPIPILAEFGSDAEFGLASLEHFSDLAAIAAEKFELHAIELPLDLIEERNQQRNIDGMGEDDPQRADLAALEGGGKRPCTAAAS
jgi:hypothetical protein